MSRRSPLERKIARELDREAKEHEAWMQRRREELRAADPLLAEYDGALAAVTAAHNAVAGWAAENALSLCGLVVHAGCICGGAESPCVTCRARELRGAVDAAHRAMRSFDHAAVEAASERVWAQIKHERQARLDGGGR